MLLVAGDGDVITGKSDARVTAEVAAHGRSPKIIVFKYKAKVRYRRKRGHRQDYTELVVNEIRANGKTAKAEKASPPPAAKQTQKRSVKQQKEEIEESVADLAAGAGADAPEQEVEQGTAAKAPRGRKAQVKAVAEGALADTPEAEIEQNAERAEPAVSPKARRPRKKKEG